MSLLLPATSESNSFIQISLEEIVGGGRGDIYFLVCDFARFHHNNFRDTISWECIVKDDCITSCLIEFESFTLSKVLSTQYIVSWCLFHVFCLYHASLYGSLCSLSMGFTAVKNTVCLSLFEFCPPGINSELMMECKLIAHPYSCSEGSIAVLNDVEELGDKEFLVLTSQCNIEIFSCFLRLSPLYSSTFDQTNFESSQIRSEDNQSFNLQNSIAPSSSRTK